MGNGLCHETTRKRSKPLLPWSNSRRPCSGTLGEAL